MGQNWNTENIPGLTGKIIIVTGANSGIGLESAREFARKGAEVILACRSMDKAQTALADIQQTVPGAKAEIMMLDLSSLKSVRQFVETFKGKYRQLDVLLNNAGIMWVPYGKTEDGFERQFGTNHLGHFALTGLLLDMLLSTSNARVVNVSSMGHRSGVMDFDNLMFEDGQDYGEHRSYSRSKLANLLFTYELQRRFEAAGASATAVAAHPGGSNTNLGNHLLDAWYWRLLYPLMALMAQSAAMGALPSIRAAVDPNVKGAEYYGPNGFMEARGYPVVVQSNDASNNKADANRLWEISEKLTGVQFAFSNA
ncbi:MAG: oxidoreductase [Chloroflexota bacterium]